METFSSLTPLDMFRDDPVETVLFTLLPVLLAIGQLANSFLDDLSFAVSIPFAVVLLGLAAVLNQYRFARFRRQMLERQLDRYP